MREFVIDRLPEKEAALQILQDAQRDLKKQFSRLEGRASDMARRLERMYHEKVAWGDWECGSGGEGRGGQGRGGEGRAGQGRGGEGRGGEGGPATWPGGWRGYTTKRYWDCERALPRMWGQVGSGLVEGGTMLRMWGNWDLCSGCGDTQCLCSLASWVCAQGDGILEVCTQEKWLLMDCT